jgi:energy-coupling factor transporter ATP-binding protein EcfA2
MGLPDVSRETHPFFREKHSYGSTISRSIKELDLTFSDGKNVIVGRNNSGKSNIVAALDAVLSESSPTYHKTQNITEKDFRAWKETVDGEEQTHSADEIFIWCELARRSDEPLNYEEMYGCRKLPRHSEGDDPYNPAPPSDSSQNISLKVTVDISGHKAKLKVSRASFPNSDVGLDLHVEVVLVPHLHFCDVPGAGHVRTIRIGVGHRFESG